MANPGQSNDPRWLLYCYSTFYSFPVQPSPSWVSMSLFGQRYPERVKK